MRRPGFNAVTLTLLHVLLLWWGQVARQVEAAFQLPPFLQTLSGKGVGQSQAAGTDRVYALPSAVRNVPNIRRFTPRKKHLKPHKLMRRLRKDWDPFWMSVDRPQDSHAEVVKEAPADPSLHKAVERLNFTLRGPQGVDQGIEQSVTLVLQAWLLQRSTCLVHYVWDDLGVLYWPRWIRRGFCQARGARSPTSSPFSSASSSSSSSSVPSLSESCSWPPGMHCVPGESRRIRILRWQCRHNKAFNNWNRRYRKKQRGGSKTGRGWAESAVGAGGGGRSKREAGPGLRDGVRGEVSKNHSARAVVEETNETENWSRKPFKLRRRKLSMRCKWKKIPYPVTDDCFCSC